MKGSDMVLSSSNPLYRPRPTEHELYTQCLLVAGNHIETMDVSLIVRWATEIERFWIEAMCPGKEYSRSIAESREAGCKTASRFAVDTVPQMGKGAG